MPSSVKELPAAANASVAKIGPQDAAALIGGGNVLEVDVRDARAAERRSTRATQQATFAERLACFIASPFLLQRSRAHASCVRRVKARQTGFSAWIGTAGVEVSGEFTADASDCRGRQTWARSCSLSSAARFLGALALQLSNCLLQVRCVQATSKSPCLLLPVPWESSPRTGSGRRGISVSRPVRRQAW